MFLSSAPRARREATTVPQQTGRSDAATARIVDERSELRADCPLFPPGDFTRRLTVTTPDPFLVVAGDHVRVDLPVALMERAATSGLLAANTLLQSGDDAAKSEFLPGIASGETIATLAFTEPSGKWDESGITMEATGSGSDWKLNGTKMFVLDGNTASLIIVAAIYFLSQGGMG